jgi:hypothetical protein
VEGDSFLADPPELWTKGPVDQLIPDNMTYDLHPDGQRLVVKKAATEKKEQDLESVVFIQNFFDYLKEKVPVNP